MRGKIRAPLRGPRVLNRDIDVTESIERLEAVVRDIVLGKSIKSSFEDLYRWAYKIVLRKQGDRLYTAVQSVVYETLSARLGALGKQEFVAYAAAHSTKAVCDEEREGVELKLFELKQAWADNQISGSMITDILMYLDRVYVVDTRRLSTADLVSLAFAKAFRDVRYAGEDEATAPQQVLIKFFSEQLDRHRRGEIVDLSLLEKVAACLKVASEHAEGMESPYNALEGAVLDATRLFYREEAEVWSKHASAEVYEAQIPQRVSEEAHLCTLIFGEESAKSIRRVVEDEFEKQRPVAAS